MLPGRPTTHYPLPTTHHPPLTTHTPTRYIIAWQSVVLLRLLHHAMNDYHARAQIARYLTALADEDAYKCGLHIPCYFDLLNPVS